MSAAGMESSVVSSRLTSVHKRDCFLGSCLYVGSGESPLNLEMGGGISNLDLACIYVSSFILT